MKRSMLQVYVKDSANALLFYQKAFDATVLCSYPDADGKLMHSELDIHGQVLAVSERTSENAVKSDETITGNIMQFCLHFGEGSEETVIKAYEILKVEAKVIYPLAPCEYSPLMTDLIDKYGVRWCLFV
jgi:Uncharacterized protein conserved in bacteria